MAVTIGGIPVYDALITDEDTGMLKISLVDDPAVMSNFQKFSKAGKTLQMYAVQDEEKRLVRGVVMRADFPIYRRDGDFEYYVIYKAAEIRKMAEKYLAESRQNNVNTMHEEGSDVDGVQMVQYFIKGDGIAVDGFDGIADGSLFAEFHVINDDVWKSIKDGTYKGFSLEGVFNFVPEKDAERTAEIVNELDGAFNRIIKNSSKRSMSKLSRLKAALAKVLQGFGNMTTDKGVLAWDGEDDLKVGDSVYIEDADGNQTQAADGDYKTDENKIVAVADGKVTEIRDSAESAEDMAAISTDKGDLSYDGDLEVGTAVYVTGEDGERTAAPDGDYKADGRTIKVADGKVSEIIEEAQETTADEVKAKRLRHMRIAQAFSASYSEKQQAISDALSMAMPAKSYADIIDAGDDFCVADIYDAKAGTDTYMRFPVIWNEDGTASLGKGEEVKCTFVPVDAPDPWEAPTESEYKALITERDTLKRKVEEMSRKPLAKPAHEEVTSSAQFAKTGDKGLDNLARILSAK